MENQVTSVLDATKEKIRIEISTQVEEFLKRGGRIDILTDPTRGDGNRGVVWHGDEEAMTLTDLNK